MACPLNVAKVSLIVPLFVAMMSLFSPLLFRCSAAVISLFSPLFVVRTIQQNTNAFSRLNESFGRRPQNFEENSVIGRHIIESAREGRSPAKNLQMQAARHRERMT